MSFVRTFIGALAIITIFIIIRTHVRIWWKRFRDLSERTSCSGGDFFILDRDRH